MRDGAIADETTEGVDTCLCTARDRLRCDGDGPQVLTAMGNDTRYELRRIANADDGVCVCDLGSRGRGQSERRQPGAFRLYTAELVTRRKEGSWRYYESTETTVALLETLDDLRGAHE